MSAAKPPRSANSDPAGGSEARASLHAPDGPPRGQTIKREARASLDPPRAGDPTSRTLRVPLGWTLLVAMWLVLNESLSLGQLAVGALVALAAVNRMRALEVPRVRLHSLRTAVVLTGVVLADIVRSNIAVACIVLRPGAPRHAPGFVDIPLELRDRVGLAVLGCIITATPGTTWSGYDDVAGTLTLHVLDLEDAGAMRATIKGRYERRLQEIFE